MQTVYATIIRDRQDFWDYPTDLIGVYPTRKAAEESRQPLRTKVQSLHVRVTQVQLT